MIRSHAARAASVALATALAVIAGVTLGGVARSQHTSVRLWHSYGDEEAIGLARAVEAFERAHPGVDVVVSAIPWGAYASKLEAAIPVRRGPDLFIDAHNRANAYAEAGLIQPFGALDPALEGDLEPGHLDALRVDGALQGVPLNAKGAVLYVNDELVGDQPIGSLEEIAALALPEGTFPLAWDGDDAYQFAALLHAYGGEMIAEDGTYRFVGPEAEAAATQLVSMVRDRVVPEETGYELVRDLFRGGRAACAISGPWLAYDLDASARWSVRPLPMVRDPGQAMRSYATIEGAMIAATAREPAAARELALFLAGPEGSRVRALEGRHPVASRSAWLDPRLASDARLVAFRAGASAARLSSTHRHASVIFVPAERALRKILRGDATVHDALVEGQHRFEDETRAPPPRRDPLFGLLALGILLLSACFTMVQRARDPRFRADVRRSLPAYKWVAHAAIAVGILVVLPLAVGAGTSFFAGHGRDLHYVGISNYVEIVTARGGDLLGHGSFWAVLIVTVLWTAANISLHVVIGVALALLLSRPELKLKGVYRVLLVLPWAVPSYVTALAWRGMFHRQFGAVNALIELLGGEPVSWFAQWSTAFAANVATNVWLGFPFMMVVTLGALTAIPKDLYEAAEVDGATKWQQFRHVTLPLLRPSLAPAVAMGAVWTFNMFNVVYLVSAGEPDGTTEILVSEAYRWAFTRGHQYGYAAAYAVLIFLLLFFGTRSISGLGAANPLRRRRAREAT